MRVLIDIIPPIPASINQSYIPFGYYNFGLGCWVYENSYDGEIEWINTMHWMSMPKYPNPQAFRYLLRDGVQAIVTPQISVVGQTPSVQINGHFYNAADGTGMPLLVE